MELYFTEEEMIKFLEKRGYTLMQIDTHRLATWREEIHTQKSLVNIIVDCVFKNNYPKDISNMDSNTWLNKYGIKTVFQKELKKTLLSL